MPRFAVVDDGVVVGVLGASTLPSLNVPANRVFVDVTELPAVKGGEIYNPVLGMFSQPPSGVDASPSLEARVAKIEKTLAGVIITPKGV